MLPSHGHIGSRDPRPRGVLQDPQLLVDGIPSTALNTRINLNTLCIRRHRRKPRLTPMSYLRQRCPVEIAAAPRSCIRVISDTSIQGIAITKSGGRNQLKSCGLAKVSARHDDCECFLSCCL